MSRILSFAKRAARKSTSPFRGFFNQHFAMVKQEVVATRDQTLAGRAELQHAAAQLAATAARVDDATTLLGARVGKVLQLQDETAAAVAALDARSAAQASSDDVDVLWCSVAARALRDVAPTARVLLLEPASPLAAVLTALGHTVVGAGAGGPAAAVVGRSAADAAAVADAALTADGVLIATVTSADPLPAGFVAANEVASGTGRIVVARRA